MTADVSQPWLTDPIALEAYHLMASRTVAVDFDGVIHPYTNGWTGSVPDDDPPNPAAVVMLRLLHERGYRIVVFSTRADHDEGHVGIREWLVRYDLDALVDGVTHTKPAAVAYIDDRAVAYIGDAAAAVEAVDRLAEHRTHGAAPAPPVVAEPAPVRTDWTREELVAICERGAVPVGKWRNRDTAGAQIQMGRAWALLKAGCDFSVHPAKPQDVKSGCFTDEHTIWLDCYWPGFQAFEYGRDDQRNWDDDGFYLPTPARLDADGDDWY